MGISKIGVVGAGTMGNGIAQTLAVAGRDVVMMDVAEEQVKRGLDTIGASLDRLIKKDKMTAAEKATAMARISTASSISALADCDLVIEAATERVDLKLRIFAELDSVVKPDAILASNTSSISTWSNSSSRSTSSRLHRFSANTPLSSST